MKKIAVVFLMSLFVFSCNKEKEMPETKSNRKNMAYGIYAIPEVILEVSNEELEKRAEAARLERLAKEDESQIVTYTIGEKEEKFPKKYGLKPEYFVGTWLRIEKAMIGYTVFGKEYIEIDFNENDNTYSFIWYLQPENPFSTWTYDNKPVRGILEYENDELILNDNVEGVRVYRIHSSDPEHDGGFGLAEISGRGEAFGHFQRKEVLEVLALE